MTSVSPPHAIHRRSTALRWMGLLVASLLLHLVVVGWIDGNIGLPSWRDRKTVITAALRPIQLPSEPVAAIKPEPPLPAVKPKTLKTPKAREAKPHQVHPATAPTENTATPIVPADSPAADNTPDKEQGAGADDITAADAQPAADAAASSAESSTGSAGAKTGYKVNPPPSAELKYKIIRKEPRLEQPFLGEALISWQRDQDTYRMRTEAGLSVIFKTVNLFALTSEGQINATGIAPVTTTETRRGRSETATHFNRDKGTITFSASTASVPLADGAQDQSTFMMQLAGMGRADAGQFRENREISMLIGESREATLFTFVIAGQEEIETGMGKFMSWHVVRPPRPGSYSSRLDIWFAPALNWYPIQIRNSEANGSITTQSVSEILVAAATQKQ